MEELFHTFRVFRNVGSCAQNVVVTNIVFKGMQKGLIAFSAHY